MSLVYAFKGRSVTLGSALAARCHAASAACGRAGACITVTRASIPPLSPAPRAPKRIIL